MSCGGYPLTKAGTYATRRQADPLLFGLRIPIPPFAVHFRRDLPSAGRTCGGDSGSPQAYSLGWTWDIGTPVTRHCSLCAGSPTHLHPSPRHNPPASNSADTGTSVIWSASSCRSSLASSSAPFPELLPKTTEPRHQGGKVPRHNRSMGGYNTLARPSFSQS